MTSRTYLPRRDVILAYIRLPHLTPILAVLLATAAFALIVRGGWPGTVDFAMLLMAMLGGQLAIGATNELVDVGLDRIAKPQKPLVSGLATERGARLMIALGLFMMLVGSLRFNLAAFALCALGTGLGVAYSLWFKRTAWSWIPYILAIPLIPLWVWTALDRVPGALVVLYPIAIPALVSLQVAQSLPDIEGDTAVGVRTLAVISGERRARTIIAGCVLASAGMAALAAPLVLTRPWLVWGATLAAMGLVALNAAIWRNNPERARLATFPIIAGAVGMIGVGWALAMAG